MNDVVIPAAFLDPQGIGWRNMMDERILISRAASGDREAFASLYMLYRDSLYRYAYFKLGNGSDAEDAVSACIVAAYENIGDLRVESAFKAWIFRILYRCCCALVKEQIKALDYAGEEAIDRLPYTDGGISPELSEAFGVLSRQDRDIVLLSVIAGYSSFEIASIMSLKPSTVRSRLKRGLSKMRNFLDTE